MKRLAALVSLVLVLAFCGRKGPLELPSAPVLAPVENPSAVQRGREIMVEWVNPMRYLDGRPAGELESVEVWAIEQAAGKATERKGPVNVTGDALLVARIPAVEFREHLKKTGAGPQVMVFVFSPSRVEAGIRCDFYLRARDRKGRFSDFSSPVSVIIADCPVPPADVRGRVFQDLIELVWSASAGSIQDPASSVVDGYNIYRRNESGSFELRAAVGSGQTSFEDRDFAFGRRYVYLIRAFSRREGRAVESSDSSLCEIETRDVFPPAPPRSVTAVSGPGGVSIIWEASSASDVAGYRISRKELPAGDFRLLGKDPVRETVFLDKTAVPGTTYIYAVSACDVNGNESRLIETKPVEAGRK